GNMVKKLLSITLVALLTNLITVPAIFAKSSAEKEEQKAEKVKAGIQKLGIGEQARVKLRLKDKTKLEGYVSEVSDESFVVVDPKSGSSTTVSYPQVGQVKGHNLSKGAKIAIGVGIGVIVLAAVVAIVVANSDIKFPN